jgi:hypothetical protein
VADNLWSVSRPLHTARHPPALLARVHAPRAVGVPKITNMPTLPRRRLAWVLLLTLVVAALAPGLSRALAFAQGHLAPWSVVCSTPADPSGAPARDAVHLLEHCAWCSLHGDQLAPPPLASALQHPLLRGAVPALFLQAPRRLPVWATAQARAPPAAA